MDTHTVINPVSVSFSKSSQPALFLVRISFLGLLLLSLPFPPLFCFALCLCPRVLAACLCCLNHIVTPSAPNINLDITTPPTSIYTSPQPTDQLLFDNRKRVQDITASASYHTPSRPRHTASRVPLVVQPHLAVATRLTVSHRIVQ